MLISWPPSRLYIRELFVEKSGQRSSRSGGAKATTLCPHHSRRPQTLRDAALAAVGVDDVKLSEDWTITAHRRELGGKRSGLGSIRVLSCSGGRLKRDSYNKSARRRSVLGHRLAQRGAVPDSIPRPPVHEFENGISLFSREFN
jgi:hypothetical protein